MSVAIFPFLPDAEQAPQRRGHAFQRHVPVAELGRSSVISGFTRRVPNSLSISPMSSSASSFASTARFSCSCPAINRISLKFDRATSPFMPSLKFAAHHKHPGPQAAYSDSLSRPPHHTHEFVLVMLTFFRDAEPGRCTEQPTRSAIHGLWFIGCFVCAHRSPPVGCR